MPQVTLLWSLWLRLLQPFTWAFTRPGHRRFVEWVTALALNVEEHTITQSVVAIERTADWKAMETFAEYGAWRPDYVTSSLTRLVEQAPGRTWYGYRVPAVDDTKVHRSGEDVWGTCTFHEYTARCPNRAATVRAHNWVVLGALLDNPEQPAWFLPLAGKLYFRKSQLPSRSGSTGPYRARASPRPYRREGGTELNRSSLPLSRLTPFPPPVNRSDPFSALTPFPPPLGTDF